VALGTAGRSGSMAKYSSSAARQSGPRTVCDKIRSGVINPFFARVYPSKLVDPVGERLVMGPDLPYIYEGVRLIA
jgi:hypothetical protein